MAFHSTTFHWEAPVFNFNSPQQSEDLQVFHTRATDYLEALNIDAEADDCKTSWKQLKMMFEDDDWQNLQTLINNGTITPASQKMPQQVLDTTGTTMKSDDYFWHFWDELLSDVCQLPDEGIHALNTCITTLINQCKFPCPQTQEILEIMVLQHAMRFNEARDWIWLQDQSQLTYKALLSHCQLLEF